MDITLHTGDIPAELVDPGALRDGCLAVDTETMGLLPGRDRLCVVQLGFGDGNAHLVQLRQGGYDAPNLCRLLTDPGVTKIFHFARFDMVALRVYLGVDCKPVFCTKIASKLARTYTDRHGLRDLCRDILGVEISKQQQSSDWGAQELSEEQKLYAANDVLYLHDLRERLRDVLIREDRYEMARACFDFLPARAELDRRGWTDVDIFAHS